MSRTPYKQIDLPVRNPELRGGHTTTEPQRFLTAYI